MDSIKTDNLDNEKWREQGGITPEMEGCLNLYLSKQLGLRSDFTMTDMLHAKSDYVVQCIHKKKDFSALLFGCTKDGQEFLLEVQRGLKVIHKNSDGSVVKITNAEQRAQILVSFYGKVFLLSTPAATQRRRLSFKNDDYYNRIYSHLPRNGDESGRCVGFHWIPASCILKPAMRMHVHKKGGLSAMDAHGCGVVTDDTGVRKWCCDLVLGDLWDVWSPDFIWQPRLWSTNVRIRSIPNHERDFFVGDLDSTIEVIHVFDEFVL